jgi:hypothetical protein
MQAQLLGSLRIIRRARHQDLWVLSLYRAMQAAIGEQLKRELELPGDLTPELAVLANRIEKQTNSCAGPRQEGKILGHCPPQ